MNWLMRPFRTLPECYICKQPIKRFHSSCEIIKQLHKIQDSLATLESNTKTIGTFTIKIKDILEARE